MTTANELIDRAAALLPHLRERTDEADRVVIFTMRQSENWWIAIS